MYFLLIAVLCLEVVRCFQRMAGIGTDISENWPYFCMCSVFAVCARVHMSLCMPACTCACTCVCVSHA